MNEKWGKDKFGGHLRIQTEVVNGVISYIPMGNPNTKMIFDETDGPQKG